MYRKLKKINDRPASFEHYTAADLWTDEHTSSNMLACHLDDTVDLSSRKHAFIDRSAAWIISRFGLDESKSVADFGCGPGLYTTRLAASGADVTGIDFSERSIRYAKEQSQEKGLVIDYVHADYLEYITDKRFDLIIMIMCDFCALSPKQRRIMLDKFLAHIKPGGALLFDVHSLSAFDEREEATIYAPNLLDGFWSPDPYFGFQNTFKYEEDKVVLDKYTVVEESRTRVVYNWLQYFDHEVLKNEVEDRGFKVEAILGDVAGEEFAPASQEFAIIATR